MALTVSTLDVLNRLSHVTWRSAIEVADEITFLRGGMPGWWNAGRVLAGVHVELQSLHDGGLVQRRHRDLTPERLAVRGGRQEFEYQLTEDGLRRKVEAGMEALGGTPFLQPKPA